MEATSTPEPTNDSEVLVQRDASGHLLPGSILNPEGKKPGTRNFTTKVREALEKIADGNSTTFEEVLVQRILKKAIEEGNDKMIRLIWNYLDGLPQQNLKVVGDKFEPVTIHIIDGRSQSDTSIPPQPQQPPAPSGK